jgi:hypothetical protein
LNLLNFRVVLAVLELLALILKVQEVLVGHDVARVFSFRNRTQKGGGLRLGKSELVMDKSPEVLCLVICNRLGAQLAPSTLADDPIKLSSVRRSS